MDILAIHDPALYAAFAFRDALERHGIAIRGEAVARHAASPTTGVELARRDSEPLLEALRVAAKVSQNLHAELILRAVGRAGAKPGPRRRGSRRCGLS